MNILILTGRFGMGHSSATAAIKDEIECNIPSVNVQVVDIIDYLLPSTSKILYSGFNLMVSRLSNIYNIFCKTSENYSSAPFKGIFIQKLDLLMSQYNPDIVISTLPIGSQYISAYKKIRNINLPLYTYITDLCTHAEWISDNTDLYFVGTHELKNSLIEKGIAPEQVRVTGIPVRNSFKTVQPINGTKVKKKVLIMGGGLGLMPFSDELYKVLHEDDSVDVTVITGKNENLYESLKFSYPNFNAILYTDKVYEYMNAADLLISKAGGITLFEAIHTETPIYVINPFLLQEIYNAKYIESRNLGVVIWKEGSSTSSDILSLIKNDDTLSTYKNNMRKLKNELDEKAMLREIALLRKECEYEPDNIGDDCSSEYCDPELWNATLHIL